MIESKQMWSTTVAEREGDVEVQATVMLMGHDCLVAVWGGTVPHIGAVGMAQVRPSLADPQQPAATSSVFTYLGHKEDVVAKLMAEELARALERNTVVVAGIHWDNLSEGAITTIVTVCKKLTGRIKERVREAADTSGALH